MTLVWLAALLAALVGASQLLASWRLARLRRSGVYPLAGQATAADVDRLIMLRMPLYASRCYREVHGVGLKEAREKVRMRSSVLLK